MTSVVLVSGISPIAKDVNAMDMLNGVIQELELASIVQTIRTVIIAKNVSMVFTAILDYTRIYLADRALAPGYEGLIIRMLNGALWILILRMLFASVRKDMQVSTANEGVLLEIKLIVTSFTKTARPTRKSFSLASLKLVLEQKLL